VRAFGNGNMVDSLLGNSVCLTENENPEVAVEDKRSLTPLPKISSRMNGRSRHLFLPVGQRSPNLKWR